MATRAEGDDYATAGAHIVLFSAPACRVCSVPGMIPAQSPLPFYQDT